jgi:hypothetical protein
LRAKRSNPDLRFAAAASSGSLRFARDDDAPKTPVGRHVCHPRASEDGGRGRFDGNRRRPNGQIVGALPNGLLVSIINMADDANGEPWAFIARYDNARPIGSVFREFIACF